MNLFRNGTAQTRIFSAHAKSRRFHTSLGVIYLTRSLSPRLRRYFIVFLFIDNLVVHQCIGYIECFNEVFAFFILEDPGCRCVSNLLPMGRRRAKFEVSKRWARWRALLKDATQKRLIWTFLLNISWHSLCQLRAFLKQMTKVVISIALLCIIQMTKIVISVEITTTASTVMIIPAQKGCHHCEIAIDFWNCDCLASTMNEHAWSRLFSTCTSHHYRLFLGVC